MFGVGLMVLALACGDSSSSGDGSGMDGGGTGGATTVGEDGEVVVQSADGLVVLTIPPGALPPGTDPLAIAIEPADGQDLELEGMEYLVGYDLLPDGLEFSAPASLQWTLDLPQRQLATLWHLGADSVDNLAFDNLETTASGSSVVTVPIAHFSRLLVATHRSGVVLGEIVVVREAGDAPVGGQVSATVNFNRTGTVVDPFGQIGYSWGKYHHRFTAVDEPWQAKLVGLRGGEAVLSPERVSSSGFGTGVQVQQRSAAFTCADPGGASILWGAFIDPPVLRTRTDRQSGAETTQLSRVVALARFTNDVTCFDAAADPRLDGFDTVSSAVATFFVPGIDIVSNFASLSSVTQDQADALTGSLYNCGDSDDAGRLTVCPPGTSSIVAGPRPPSALQAGQLLTATMTLDDAVPTGDTEHSYIYSLVLDSDGDPANDWVFQPPFDWDVFQGADRWYQLIWDHIAQQWTLTVTQVAADQTTTEVSSEAWAVIDGPHINFFVPEAEFDPAVVRYRVTSFGHDGAFSPDDRGLDVSGADPTEPLRPIDRR